MRSGLERIVDRRAISWQLVLPTAAAEAGATDTYFRPSRAVQEQTLEFQGFSVPLGESKTGQHDIGHVTRGDQMLYVTKNGADLSVFKPDMEIIDIGGGRWGIVQVEDFSDKLHPGHERDSEFLRMQITRRALQ